MTRRGCSSYERKLLQKTTASDNIECQILLKMGRRINISGKNVESQSTGQRISEKRRVQRDSPIRPYKIPETIYEGYRYHRRGKHIKANDEIKT